MDLPLGSETWVEIEIIMASSVENILKHIQSYELPYYRCYLLDSRLIQFLS